MKKKAFTLAEVLITLGIIGIVAAMTMPTVITNYKRHVAETKLQKFYSVINNTMKMIEKDYGEITEITSNRIEISQFSKEFYEKYFIPYMSNVIIKDFGDRYSTRNYIIFADGSAFKVRGYLQSVDFLYYLDLKLDQYGNVKNRYENEFYFQYNPKKHIVAPYGIYFNYENLTDSFNIGRQKSDCYSKSYHYYCAAVIQRNGWKIPKDYPHIK